MPKKRKKGNQRKPSLVFTESPVNIQTHAPTPVLCARHPQTAETVSVCDLEDVPWVSPQFRGAALHSDTKARRRVTRQRRHSLGSTLASTANINKENTHCGGTGIAGHRKTKYKSLKFVGDQTTVASLVEDVDISCDTETTEDEGMQDKNKISDLDTSGDDNHHRKRSRTNIKIGKRGDQLVLSEVSESNKKHEGIRTTQNVETCNVVDLDMHGLTAQGHTSAEMNSSSLGSKNKPTADIADTKQSKTQGRKHLNHKKNTKMKNLRKSIFNLSALSSDSDSSMSGPDHFHSHNENQGTQRLYHVSIKSPVKRLFTNQLRGTSPAFDGGNSEFPPAENSEMENLCNDSSIANSDDSDQKTPIRRSKRIAANLKRLAREGTPLGKPLRIMKVLVADTPDSEKGLSIRQKQLKGIL